MNNLPQVIPIVLYHKCPPDLERHLQYIKDRNLITAHLSDSEVSEYLQTRKADEFPKKRIVLTFDDAFQDFFDKAYPLLNKFKFKATISVPTGYISDNKDRRKTTNWHNAEDPLAPTMTWDELKELAENPLFEIIPHSVRHINLNELANLLNIDAIRYEIECSKLALEYLLGINDVQFFCLPYGAGEGSEIINDVLKDLSYTGALRAQYKTGDNWNQYRIPRCEASNYRRLRELLNGEFCCQE